MTITADCGGSNSDRTRLWKAELQKLADETGLQITVCHFPPGTSKWNAIEHRLFSFIGTNWRDKPLESLEVIINLIAGTTTNMRIVHHYVDEAVEAQDLSETERLGIDDTSFRRGQDYVSVFCDPDPGERRACLRRTWAHD